MRRGLGLGFNPQMNAGIDPIPYNRFTYNIDFVNGTTKGGIQPYGNNNNDGRFFRDSGNFQATKCPDQSGALVTVASAGLRRTDKGLWCYPDVAILGLWGSDLSQSSVWIPSNITALKNQTGPDGVANSASSITATAANGTISQTITSASANRVRTAYVKRLVGTGTLEMSLDGGATWTVVPTFAGFNRVIISGPNITNPVIMYRIATSGDSFAVAFDMTHGRIRSAVSALPTAVATQGTAYGTLSHSTPWALNTDAGPLWSIIQGAFAFYWEGVGDITNIGTMFVSDGVTNCQATATGAITFAPGLTTPDGQWLSQAKNKVAGYIDGALNMALCVNGNTPVRKTGGALSPAATHFVVSSNGAGSAAHCGTAEKFAIDRNLTFTDADLVAMTT